jgi:GT2 family glycosyltransferase
MSHRTAVVILNWNTRHFLEKFLPDVIKYTSYCADIIVADNASTDDSVAYTEKNFPEVRIIRNSENEGFAGGYNTALRQIKNEYYVLLNSDVKVTENWLEPLVELLDSNPTAGACQPKMLSFLEPDKFEYAGAAGGFIDKLGYPFCRGRIFNALEEDNDQYNNPIPVFWSTGACMVVRSKVYWDSGALDPLFFAHMEEIDLCWRIQRSGYRIFYCPSSKVYHVGGGTLPKTNPRKTYLNFRNNLLMIYKNTPKSKFSLIFLYRILLDFLASLKFLFSGSYSDCKAVWKAHKDFNNLRSLYSGPVPVTKALETPILLMIYPKSILWDYYLCGRKKFSSLGWKQVDNQTF